MLVRWMVGKNSNKTLTAVAQRLQDIQNGVYQSELAKLKIMSEEELLTLYQDFHATKGKAV